MVSADDAFLNNQTEYVRSALLKAVTSPRSKCNPIGMRCVVILEKQNQISLVSSKTVDKIYWQLTVQANKT